MKMKKWVQCVVEIVTLILFMGIPCAVNQVPFWASVVCMGVLGFNVILLNRYGVYKK